MKHIGKLAVSCLLVVCAGCAGYRWTSEVPEAYRTVAIPVFENRSKTSQLGPVLAQYTAREFQREGTFKIRRTGDAAIEVQGVILKTTRGVAAYDRAHGTRANEYRYVVTASVTFIDRLTGKTLQADRKYIGETTFLVQGDVLTGQQNASQRVAQDIARQIVDDLVSWKFEPPETSEGSANQVK